MAIKAHSNIVLIDTSIVIWF